MDRVQNKMQQAPAVRLRTTSSSSNPEPQQPMRMHNVRGLSNQNAVAEVGCSFEDRVQCAVFSWSLINGCVRWGGPRDAPLLSVSAGSARTPPPKTRRLTGTGATVGSSLRSLRRANVLVMATRAVPPLRVFYILGHFGPTRTVPSASNISYLYSAVRGPSGGPAQRQFK